LVAFTPAPLTTAPFGSVIVPAIWPVVPCDREIAAKKSSAITAEKSLSYRNIWVASVLKMNVRFFKIAIVGKESLPEPRQLSMFDRSLER
jgi:hypothetical protein